MVQFYSPTVTAANYLPSDGNGNLKPTLEIKVPYIARIMPRLVFAVSLLVIVSCQAIPQPNRGNIKVRSWAAVRGSAPITTFVAENNASKKASRASTTFGQPFVAGDVPKGTTLQAVTRKGQKLPTQVDWKASNQDGSLRHGIITVQLPAMKAGQSMPIALYRKQGTTVSHRTHLVTTPPKKINARVVLSIHGEFYSASFQKLLSRGVDKTWLSGPLVTEWHVSGPVTNKSDKPHDRLWTQFYLRYYPKTQRARFSVIVENSWALQANPRNVTYDVQVFVNGQQVYKENKLTHTDHARWRKIFWTGGSSHIYVKQDLAYLKATGTIPNYDPTLKVPESARAKFYKHYLKSSRGPMDISIVEPGMPNTGGRPDIGPLPAWDVLRLLTMDPRLIQADRKINTLAGSWPIHLRDKQTKLPLSLKKHPQFSTHPNMLGSAKNPMPKANYGEYPNKLRPSQSHEPAVAFVPYLLSGDFYYLEELQFWAAWNPLRTSPEYRGKEKGLLKWLQVRGQAWTLRALGQVAYITPDDNPMKSYWNQQLKNNLAWYNSRYVHNPDANKLGFLVGLMPYHHGRGLAPWQDDFFTWAIGYLANLGFDEARPMLEYKTRFPTGRMIAPGYCWVFASIYSLNVRDDDKGGFYKTFARTYAETVSSKVAAAPCAGKKMAYLMGKHYKAGDMYGYPDSPQGFPANMQPALATAVDAGTPGAARAWSIFSNRTTKPDYSDYPNWDIVPRKTQ